MTQHHATIDASTIKANEEGRFGLYGGSYVPPTLQKVLDELNDLYKKCLKDPAFIAELTDCYHNIVARPTNLYEAKRLTQKLGGARIFFKREDLCHTGAHKLNNAIGQALLAKRSGKKRVIAETGAGQHGVATATACTLFGLECIIYMGAEDILRQKLNVFRMQLLGAKVVSVTRGTATLSDAVDEALEDYVANAETTHYLIGSAVGPHPYPEMVRFFQSIIGRESRQQMLDTVGKLPDTVVACVGGGSNAIGMFAGFVKDKGVRLVGIEGAGKGINTPDNAATLTLGRPGVLHGSYSYVLQDENGDVPPAYSISAGLDYPSVGPEHSYLKDTERAYYEAVTDEEALNAFMELSRTEGIIPALESSHAAAYVIKNAPKLPKDHIILMNLSGRGDKDVAQVSEMLKL
ncbi:tryptophan synthase subunit beta [Candidatus Sumerlaeota bacterium]|nr:tryptophan synthase subunit beta [Candidatus Sumerlaeales bacterium]NLD60964.1 tryptophan synthase subunit beta [Candidatus Sumerlaeota bacterium]